MPCKDDSDTPISGATVKVLAVKWKPYESRPKDALTREMQSDADGKAVFKDLPVDTSYGVSAELGDLFDIGSRYVSSRRKSTTLELSLQPCGAVAGTVVDDTGKPVPEAVLYAAKINEDDDNVPETEAEAASVRTDAEGKFRFAHVPKGKWKFAVKATGFAVLLSDWIEVGNENVLLTLVQGGDLTGRVVFADSNAPAPNIDVITSTDMNRDSQKSRTDAEGTFSFSNLRETKVTLSIDDPKLILIKAAEPVAVVAGQSATAPDLEIATGGIITGRVYNLKSNSGISGARIDLSPESVAEGTFSPRRDKPIETGSDGVYTVEGLPSGQFTVAVSEAKGYPDRRWEDRKMVSVSLGKSVSGIDFPLDAGLSASGIVVDSEGNPLGDARIGTNSQTLSVWQNATSDESGQFTVNGLVQGGGYFFTAEKEGFSTKPIGPMEVPAEGLQDLRIVMQTESTVSGVVVDTNGAPVPNAHVLAWPTPTSGSESLPGDECDERGAFTIKGLREGGYRIQAQRDNNGSWRSDNSSPVIQVAQGEVKTGVQVVLNDQGGLEITGTVTNSKGEPLRGIYVRTWGNQSSADSRTEENGSFTLKNLTEGSYNLQVDSEEYTPQEVPGIEAGTTGVAIVMEGTGTIDGRVVTASGQAVTDFEIILDRKQGIYYRPQGQGVRVQDPDGHFQLAKVPVGDASFMVRAPGFAPSKQNVPNIREGETTNEVLVRLEAGGAVSGRVLDEAGNGVAGANVYEGAAPSQNYNRNENVRAKSDSSGAFTVEGLPVGSVTLSAAASGFAASSIDVQTSAGQTTNADIVLGGGGVVRVTIRAQGFKPESMYTNIYQPSGGANMHSQIDESGVVEFKAVAAGEYQVNAGISTGGTNGVQSNRNQHRTITVAEGQTIDVEFVFEQATATLTGTVLKDGAPVTNSWVSVQIGDRTEGQGESASAQLDANGQFTIVGLPAGPARVNASAQTSSGHLSRQVNVVLTNNQTTEINIDLTGGAKITGTVSGIGNAFMCYVTALKGQVSLPARPDMAFYQEISEQGLMVGSAQVDKATGEYKLEGLEPGEYTIIVAAMDTDPSQGGSPEEVYANTRVASGTITVGEDETVTLNLALP